MLRIPGLDLDRLFRLDQDQIVGTAVPDDGLPHWIFGLYGVIVRRNGRTDDSISVDFAGVSLQNEQLPTRTISTL